MVRKGRPQTFQPKSLMICTCELLQEFSCGTCNAYGFTTILFCGRGIIFLGRTHGDIHIDLRREAPRGSRMDSKKRWEEQKPQLWSSKKNVWQKTLNKKSTKKWAHNQRTQIYICVKRTELLGGGFSPTHLKNMLIKLGHFPMWTGVKIRNIWVATT